MALSVLNELVRRHDEVMIDERISRHFASHYSSMVQMEVTGPWGMAETVRMIMNRESPVSQQINWTGPRFADATDIDLANVLTRLFEIESESGVCHMRNSYRGLSNKQMAHGEPAGFTSLEWQTEIVSMDLTANIRGPRVARSLFSKSGERAIDDVYARPMTDTGENVHVWSFLALDSEVDDEVNQTLPLVGVLFCSWSLCWGFFLGIGEMS